MPTVLVRRNVPAIGEKKISRTLLVRELVMGELVPQVQTVPGSLDRSTTRYRTCSQEEGNVLVVTGAVVSSLLQYRYSHKKKYQSL